MVLAAAALTGCHTPDSCSPGRKDLAGKTERIASFRKVSKAEAGTPWAVLQSKERSGPPVVVLPELPAVSSDLLDLATRLEKEHYTVYVPILWGKETDDATSKAVALRRALRLGFDPRFLALFGGVDRPAVSELAAFCEGYIHTRHPRERIGMIGNCLTGAFPFAVASRVPQVAAPVGSQPSIPLLLLGNVGKRSTGLTTGELRALDERCLREGLRFQMMGFRFSGDRVVPPERMTAYKDRYGAHFLNYQVPEALYAGQDNLPLHAHTVLTGCYLDGKKASTQFAWEEVLGFFQTKLRGSKSDAFSQRSFPKPNARTKGRARS